MAGHLYEEGVTVNTEVYRFKVGDLECMAVSDGTFTYGPPLFPPPAAFLFANAPKELLDRSLGEHGMRPEHSTEWISPYTCLLVNARGHLILVDTGAGSLSLSTGRLLQNLRAAEIAPDDVDTVILTHAHPDHIGGNLNSEGKLTFSKARYVMWKREWDFWTSGEAAAKLDEHGNILLAFAQRDLPPIRDRLDLVDQEKEILPGIGALSAPGHTPGHMAVAMSSRRQQLLCISDTVLHPVHLEHPEWSATVDLAPDQVVATRRRLLKKAAAEKALVLAFHFPFPGLGHIVQEGTGWQWQPIDKTG
jgi:glyoxylase-like metal-dependent hydrolase (beta-lactamase superfamily II)